jgi:hypothetical protein
MDSILKDYLLPTHTSRLAAWKADFLLFMFLLPANSVACTAGARIPDEKGVYED